ncbi:hypothetical protein MMAS_01750 [Mycobacteroides abscessus subsp. massiliense CCUG 48898 = JCM 15300]|nr:hypothetical protein MMAS_01750 [Mycobacteroides abscessus subsp. massiliense CCUG 48898 = JCM 15300]
MIIGYDLALSFRTKEANQVCAPFKPDPWVQKMPEPTESPTPAPK